MINLDYAVTAIVAWLDSHNERTREEIGLRVLKIGEEFGEAAAAWVALTGQNPRKIPADGPGDLWDELADVVITAMVALQSSGADVETVIRDRLQVIMHRIR